MKNIVLYTVLLTITCFFANTIKADYPLTSSFYNDNSLLPVNSIFIQNGNMNTVFRTDGIFNLDKVTFTGHEAGLIWPVTASSRQTMIYTSGIWIGAKTVLPNKSKELRLAASFYNSHYSPGNIPVIGQIPPQSVCNDTSFNGYLVNLTDPALVNGGTRTKVAGGRTYTFVYSSWNAWPVQLGAPYVEVNNIPGYQPAWNGDRPGTGNGPARPDELMFMVFMDYKNCTGSVHESEVALPGGTLPLGVEIQQLVYMFELPILTNAYFISYKVINKSSRVWDSTYFSLVNDADVGDPYDDAVGCDTNLNLAYGYNFDDFDPVYGQAPPAVGYSLLQGPVIYTGLNSDTAKLPCETKVGYRMLMMSGHNVFINSGSNTCITEPDNSLSAYNFMRGKDGCGNNIINPNNGLPTNFKYSGNVCSSTGWFDPTEGDKRNLSNCGPFTMNSGDTQVISYAYMVVRGTSNLQSVCNIKESAVRINEFYYNCFSLIGITGNGSIVPEKYNLSQNYPNPFNPVTNIVFDIPVSAKVKLTVFDVLGREVSVLVNEQLNTGSYKADWNASGFPSGVYFYKLETESFSKTMKMVLVK